MFLALQIERPGDLGAALAALAPQLRLQGAEASAVGAGWLEEGGPLLAKRPGQHGPVDLAHDSRGARSQSFLLFAAPPGGSAAFGEERTPPIRWRRWLLGGEGSEPSPHAARQRALDRLPEFLRRQIPGDGMLPLACLLFLDALRSAGRLDGAADSGAAASTLSAAARDLWSVEGSADFTLAAAGDFGLAVARGTRPAFWRRLAAPAPPGAALRGVAVCDAPLDPSAWTEIPERACLEVDRALEPRVHAPPAA